MNRFNHTRWDVIDHGPIAEGHRTRVYEVVRGRASYMVWTDPVARTTNCTSCSGPLSAMKSGCAHCAVVKRYLKRKARVE